MRTLRPIILTLVLVVVAALATGCASPRVNPSFDISHRQARATLVAMKADPKPLARPLVILGGFVDPIGASVFRSTCRDLFADGDHARILTVTFVGCKSFAQCRQRVIEAVDRAFPTDDPAQTSEVDVIGLSMGGLVARVASEPVVDEAGAEEDDVDDATMHRQLRIARLFTISSPLRGAKLARFPLVLTPMHRDMREGSHLLRRLNATDPPYPIYSYTRLRDRTVGEELASPAGHDPWWLDVSPLEGAHFGAAMDKRILADVARRLRDEEPLTIDPPTPLPPRVAGGAR